MKQQNLLRVILCVLLSLAFLLSLPIASHAADGTEALLRYGATTLSGNAKYVYERLEAEVLLGTPAEEIALDQERGVTVEELRHGASIFLSDYPECFWMANNYGYSHVDGTVTAITPVYTFSGDALIEAKRALQGAADAILSQLPAGSVTEQALYLHDALAKRVSYEQVGEHQTAYGALVAGKAVCAGYAAAYQLLLQQAGINAWTVTGDSVDPSTGVPIPHAWNLVWLDANTCVYTDVTWNDQDDELYHCYFQISLAEMETDHTVDTALFTLPSCSHTDHSYFDLYPANVSDTSSVADVAACFALSSGTERHATLYYEGTGDFSNWLENNISDLYTALGGKPGAYGYSFRRLGNELHVTVTGSFQAEAYTVKLTHGATLYANGPTEQAVAIGNAMQELRITVDAGYYFPLDYTVTEQNGVTVERVDSTQLRVYGTPTDDVALSLPAPVAKQREDVPNALFTATGHQSGLLSGVEAGMQYSFDGNVWIAVTSDTDIVLEKIGVGAIYLLRTATGFDRADSAVQAIPITRAEAPKVENNRLTADGALEYSIDGVTWSDFSGAVNDLPKGTCYLRVKANGSVLASDMLTLQISENGITQPDGSLTQAPNAPIFEGVEALLQNASIILYVGAGAVVLLLLTVIFISIKKKR